MSHYPSVQIFAAQLSTNSSIPESPRESGDLYRQNGASLNTRHDLKRLPILFKSHLTQFSGQLAFSISITPSRLLAKGFPHVLHVRMMSRGSDSHFWQNPCSLFGRLCIPHLLIQCLLCYSPYIRNIACYNLDDNCPFARQLQH
jgi:hypothetical protein